MKIPKHFLIGGIVVGVFALAVVAYAGYFHNRIVPHTFVGATNFSGLTREQASERLQVQIDQVQRKGVTLQVGDAARVIAADDIGFDLNVSEAIDALFRRGHEGSVIANTFSRLGSLWSINHVDLPVHVDQSALVAQIAQISSQISTPMQDVRLSVTGTTVRLLTDTKPGRVIDFDRAQRLTQSSLATLSTAAIILELRDDQPVADVSLAQSAVVGAQKMMSRGLSLVYADAQFYISPTKIGSWIVSEYDGPQLKAGLNHGAVAQYVSGVASALNVAPIPPQITTANGHVTGFTDPKVGQSVQEDQLIAQIIASLTDRAGANKSGDTLAIPLTTTQLAVSGLSSTAGITELIGKATTPFTGSPKNRILNIKNGVKFISGTVIQPGEEFSTLKTLGTIDGTTGYLPELVIKGTRTEPDFGGGLCQVSTTLFRAVMNTGLPVTERQNHSYRVSYYEKDGDGKSIGPGLDATIFEPNPDFKFRNDMSTPVLIVGYVVGDKLTFELYGTKDGRSSAIDGPHLLTSTPPGDPISLPTDKLPLGTKQQVETPHPGGSATATYRITYSDGHVAKQVFNSYYRPWPQQFLIGTNPNCTTAAQCAALTPTPVPPPVVTP